MTKSQSACRTDTLRGELTSDDIQATDLWRGSRRVDKTTTVKFYRVVQGRGAQMPFSAVLEQLHAIPEAERELEIEEQPFWVDKLSSRGNYWEGRFCRRQSTNLPPRAPKGGGLQKLGVENIGPNTVWRYFSDYSVLAIEAARNGASLPRFFNYIRTICNCRGYAAQPIVRSEDLRKLSEGRLRSLSIQIATPWNLEAVSEEQQNFKEGASKLMAKHLSTNVEIHYGLKVGDPDIAPSAVTRMVRWLRNQKADDRGKVSKIKVKAINADGESEDIDLLESHLSAVADLDLPNDDPDQSFSVRAAFLRSAFSATMPDLTALFDAGEL